MAAIALLAAAAASSSPARASLSVEVPSSGLQPKLFKEHISAVDTALGRTVDEDERPPARLAPIRDRDPDGSALAVGAAALLGVDVPAVAVDPAATVATDHLNESAIEVGVVHNQSLLVTPPLDQRRSPALLPGGKPRIDTGFKTTLNSGARPEGQTGPGTMGQTTTKRKPGDGPLPPPGPTPHDWQKAERTRGTKVTPEPDKKEDGMSAGVIIGIVAASIVAIALVVVAIYYFRRSGQAMGGDVRGEAGGYQAQPGYGTTPGAGYGAGSQYSYQSGVPGATYSGYGGDALGGRKN